MPGSPRSPARVTLQPRAKEDRKVRWQAAMDSAREQAIQAQLAAVLREQAKY
ncbi:hypothetical protein ACODT5_13070 [Streptomyces sp. 5.8]|uniref:hypothetical protein n=1 Tax=Streptomyces sp. 5.8 TaxID=3406571 RepID=UPI003BB527A0